VGKKESGVGFGIGGEVDEDEEEGEMDEGTWAQSGSGGVWHSPAAAACTRQTPR
jgi:hypothetical protein